MNTFLPKSSLLRGSNLLSCWLLLGVLLTAIFSSSTLAEDGKLEWKSCVNMSTLFSTKQGCYVIDTKTHDQKIVVEIGVGINVSAGTVLIGGGASTMLVVTVEY